MAEPVNRNAETGKFLPANKAALRHGAHTYLKSGRIPSVRGKRALVRELARIEQQLRDSIPCLDIRKELLLSQVLKAHGLLGLVELYLKRVGLAREDRWRRQVFDVQPALSFYLSMMGKQTNALQLLGLGKEEAREIVRPPYELVADEEKRGKEEAIVDHRTKSPGP